MLPSYTVTRGPPPLRAATTRSATSSPVTSPMATDTPPRNVCSNGVNEPTVAPVSGLRTVTFGSLPGSAPTASEFVGKRAGTVRSSNWSTRGRKRLRNDRVIVVSREVQNSRPGENRATCGQSEFRTGRSGGEQIRVRRPVPWGFRVDFPGAGPRG